MQQPDIQTVLNSPDFQKSSPEAKEQFLSKYYPDFRKASPDVRRAFVDKVTLHTPPVPNPSLDVMGRRSMTGPGVKDVSPVKAFAEGAIGEDAPGFFGGSGEAVHGVATMPSQIKHAMTDKPTPEEIARHERHPKMFGQPQRGVGLTIDRLLLDPQLTQFNKAKQAAKQGRTSEAVGYTGAGLVPLVGPAAAHFGEEIGDGEFKKAIGEAGTYAILNSIAGKMTEGVTPSKRLSAATGGGAKDFDVIASNLRRTAEKTGRPVKIGDLENVIKQTGRNLETDFNQLLQPIARNQRIPAEVANKLLQEANSSHLLRTPEGRATRAYLRQKALDYQRPWTLGELNKQRMDLYNSRIENKTAVGQMNAVKASDEVLANKIIEDKLKDIVYDDLTAHYGNQVNVRLLKEKQSRILDLQDRIDKRIEQLADAQAEYDAAGPVEKLGLTISAHVHGPTPHLHGLTKALKGGPEKSSNYQVRRAFPAKLQDIRTPEGRVDLAKQTARETVRNTVRNMPIAALSQTGKKKKELTPLQ